MGVRGIRPHPHFRSFCGKCDIGKLKFPNKKADGGYPSANLLLAYVEERVEPIAYRR
jgi:hypothetical protein